jgi:DNA-binding GntR family transcriptional regulator
MATEKGFPRASERAYRALREEIVRWELAPGAVLAEVELAERLQMSRTPVREALARLVADGLAVAVGGRGLEVAPMELDDVRELYEVRQALETQAARLAARRGDHRAFAQLAEELAVVPVPDDSDPDREAYYALVARFDAALDASVGNDYLVAALASVRTHLARIRRMAKDNPDRLVAAAAEHRTIATAIAGGDGDLAAHATHVHLHNSLENVLATAALAAPTTRGA